MHPAERERIACAREVCRNGGEGDGEGRDNSEGAMDCCMVSPAILAIGGGGGGGAYTEADAIPEFDVEEEEDDEDDEEEYERDKI